MTDPARDVGRLDALTGMRFLAAGAVVVAHVAGSMTGRLGAPGPHLAQAAWMGVSFFFMLSGFVLTWSASPGRSSRSFWWRRVARIYPAYLATVVLALLVARFVEQATTSPARVLAAVLLVQSWVPDREWYFAGNGVAWSLSTEAFFYLLWPVLAPAVQRLGLVGLRRLAAGLVATTLAIGAVGSTLVPSSDTFAFGGPTGHRAGWFVYICPLARLPEFVLGIVVATALRSGWRPRVTIAPAWVAVAIAYVVAQALPPLMLDEVAFEVVPLALLLAAVGAAGADGRRAPFATPGWVLAGSASYCLYLVHPTVIRLVEHRHPSPSGWTAVGVTGVVVPAALVAAYLLHRLWEEPCQAWLTGRREGSAVVRGPQDAASVASRRTTATSSSGSNGLVR